MQRIALAMGLTALVFSGCRHAGNETTTKEITIEKHDLYNRTVTAEHSDDITFTDKSSYELCDSHEVSSITYIGGVPFNNYKQWRLVSDGDMFVRITQRRTDAKTVYEKTIKEPGFFAWLVGYKDEVVMTPVTTKATYDNWTFVVADNAQNNLIVDDIMANDGENIVKYTYDRSKYIKWGDDQCRTGERRFVRLKSIWIDHGNGEPKKYDMN